MNYQNTVNCIAWKACAGQERQEVKSHSEKTKKVSKSCVQSSTEVVEHGTQSLVEEEEEEYLGD